MFWSILLKSIHFTLEEPAFVESHAHTNAECVFSQKRTFCRLCPDILSRNAQDRACARNRQAKTGSHTIFIGRTYTVYLIIRFGIVGSHPILHIGEVASSERIRQIFGSQCDLITITECLIVIQERNFTPTLVHHISTHRQPAVIDISKTSAQSDRNPERYEIFAPMEKFLNILNPAPK